MNAVTLIQPNGRNEKPNVWIAKVVGNKIVSQWGQQDGKLQKTEVEFEAVNEGKKNQRTPAQAAQDALVRAVRLKRREGYVEEVTQPEMWKAPAIDFDNLPPNLTFYKPQTSLSKGLEKIANAGDAIFTRKRDGEMFAIVVNTKGEIDIYSRRMHRSHDDEKIPWYERFKHIARQVGELNLPKKTVLLCEMIMDRDGVDDFRHVTTVTRALTTKALVQQSKAGLLTAYVWDIAFCDGHPCCVTQPYKDRLSWITARISGKNVVPVYAEKWDSVEQALAVAKERKWEGWVVVNPEGVYEDRAFNFKGKPDRPVHAGKLKPTLEADLVIEFDPDNKLGAWGTGKHKGAIGALAVFAKDAQGEMVYVGDVGTGITDDQRAKWSKTASSMFPCVAQIEFAEFTPKGILRFPRFVRLRPDKALDEIFVFEQPTGDE